MNLEAGQTLQQYRLVEQIGEGGMGVVWKAVDTTLDREVAIKGLPAAFATDPERLARFEREAKLLASLNHPNIAAIYGLHQQMGVRFLAMELVPGEDLAERLTRGAFSVEDSIEVGRQIAEALEAAHEQGVVHRDLKPANVKWTPDGKIKVLDFGLAKALMPDVETANSDLSHSPTVTSAGTVAGMILGTAAYMSPEQARGKPVDRRADIWGFGCLLYEMLTGHALFRGATVSDTIAAVLRADPEWDRLPAETPASVRNLLARCFVREPRQRLRDIGEARLVLEGSATEEPVVADSELPTRSRPVWRTALPLALGAAILAYAAGWFGGADRQPSAAGETVATRRVVDIAAPPEMTWSLAPAGPGPVAVSPNGSKLAFVAESGGETTLWVRPLDGTNAFEVPDSEGAQYPFWSADSNSVAFFSRGQLWRADLETEPRPRSLAPAPDGKGGSWNARDEIIYTPNAGEPLLVIPANGGDPRPVTELRDTEIVTHRHPRFLPDGRRFVFIAGSATESQCHIMIGSLDGDEPVKLFANPTQAEIVDNRLLWVEDGTLLERSIDLATLELGDDRRVLAQEVLQMNGAFIAAFSAVPGVLAHHRGRSASEVKLVFVTPTSSTQAFEELVGVVGFRLSPDGRRVAASLEDATSGQIDLWVLDLERLVRSRLTSDPKGEFTPVWTADGQSLIYSYPNERMNYMALYSVPAYGGEPRLLLEATEDLFPYDVSRDGKWLLYGATQSTSGSDLYLFPLDGEGEPTPVATTDYRELGGRISPGGRWISYVSNETGRWELYITRFPGGSGRKWQVSRDGAFSNSWNSDGKSIFFKWDDETVMQVSVAEGDRDPVLGSPHPVMQVPHTAVGRSLGRFDVDPRGRLLAADSEEYIDPQRISLILDWTAD